ncbi:MAG: MFS transporter [Alphaproteobacteria bacterium]|nr:MFS transporter [Alphaproteobacteria bacterium]
MTTAESAGGEAEGLPPTEKQMLGQPVGLWYLVFAEAWERFSYYGMQALLALYLSKYLLLPGHIEHVLGFGVFKGALEGMYGPLATPLAIGGALAGVYSAVVYLTPIAGGFIADRFLGRTVTVTIGALLMVLGHFLMAFEASFVFAILCLFAGIGCFKGNIASQVGELYGPNDPRRGSAYQTFLLGVQIAVIIAPLVCGFLAEEIAWHWGFGAAGIGMTIALVVYLSGRKYLPPDRMRVASGEKKGAAPLTARDWKTIGVLILLLPLLALTALGNQEIFAAYLLWGDQHFQLTFFGFKIPTSSLVSLDAFISTFTMAGVLMFWRWYGTKWKEPDEIFKVVIGALISCAAPLMLAFASAQAAITGERVSLAWGFGFHIINDVGFAMVFPIGLALFSRVSPKGITGVVIGVYYLHLFLCGLATGKLASMLGTMSGFSFWLMHAALIAGGGLAMLVFAFVFRGILAPTDAVEGESGEPQAAPAG